jgi:hypothetical protein
MGVWYPDGKSFGAHYRWIAHAQWRSNTTGGLAGVDSYSGFKTMLMGVTLSALNPKSFVLTSATAMMIYEAKIAGRQKALTLIIFSFIASLSVGLPIAYAWARRENAQKMLTELKEWLIAHNAAVTVTLLIVFALIIVGSGLNIVF